MDRMNGRDDVDQLLTFVALAVHVILNFNTVIILSLSLSLSLTHTHTHTGPRSPKELIHLASSTAIRWLNTILLYYYDVTIEVDIFVPHVLQYKRVTYWWTLTLCGSGWWVVKIVRAVVREWASWKYRGWGSLNCCSMEVRPAGRWCVRPCPLRLEKQLLQCLI